MKTFAIIASAALLSACGQANGERAEVRDQPFGTATISEPAELLTPVDTLAGEWRVAGINGEPLDETYGLALSADETEIWWEPRCAGRVRGYTIDGDKLTIGERTSEVPASSSTPAPVCLIGIPPRLNDVTAALDLAETVGRAPDNSIRISGGGRSLTLFSQ